jgi:hypothetical protein
MLWGLSLKFRLLAAAGAAMALGTLTHVPAKAADLGGDCCADLACARVLARL